MFLKMIKVNITTVENKYILNKNLTAEYKLAYAHAGDLLTVDFEPNKIYMNPATGRVYHPAWPKVGSIGLIRSKLAIELSKNFEWQDRDEHTEPPSHFMWEGEQLKLENDWVQQTQRFAMFDQEPEL